MSTLVDDLNTINEAFKKLMEIKPAIESLEDGPEKDEAARNWCAAMDMTVQATLSSMRAGA